MTKRQRSTIPKAELAKLATFLNAVGVKPVSIEMLPGKLSMTLADGDSLTVPADTGELASEVEKERLGSGRKSKRGT